MEADFINLNLEDVDDGADPLPEGLTRMRVKAATRKHKEGSEYPYIDVRLNPTEIAGKEKRTLRLTLSFHPDAQWNMKRFMKEFRIPWDPKGFALSDFPGKEGYVTLKITPDQADPTILRNEVGPPYSKVA